MPLYGYACAECGPFSATQPLAQFRAPAPCPVCGAAAERVLSAPTVLGRAQRRAGEGPPEAAAGAPRMRHAGGCGCCTARPSTSP